MTPPTGGGANRGLDCHVVRLRRPPRNDNFFWAPERSLGSPLRFEGQARQRKGAKRQGGEGEEEIKRLLTSGGGYGRVQVSGADFPLRSEKLAVFT